MRPDLDVKQGVKEGPNGASEGEAAIAAPGANGSRDASGDECQANIPNEMNVVGPHHRKAGRAVVKAVRVRKNRHPRRHPQQPDNDEQSAVHKASALTSARPIMMISATQDNENNMNRSATRLIVACTSECAMRKPT